MNRNINKLFKIDLSWAVPPLLMIISVHYYKLDVMNSEKDFIRMDK